MKRVFYLIILSFVLYIYNVQAKEKIIFENQYSCSIQGNIEFCIDAENKPLSGKVEKTDEKGNVILRSYYKDGYRNGLTAEYEKGKILRRSYYKKGIQNGEYKEFFENKTINISATYKDGKLSGNIERYNKQGDLIGRFRYKDGFLVNGYCQYKKNKKKLKKEITNSGYNQIINCED